MRKLFLFVSLGCMALTFAGLQRADAQPLVPGPSIYYDFEDFVDEVEDVSGNAVQVNAEVNGNIVQSQLAIRGNGAAHFRPDIASPDSPEIKDFFPDDYLSIDGPNVPLERVPTEAMTIAAWVNLVRYADLCDPGCAKGTDQAIYEPRSAGGSFVNHFEAKSNGKLRGRIRGGASNAENIVSTQVFIDGTEDSGAVWPNNEWFHYAQTYDKNGNGGLGAWAQYYNGVKIAEGVANGNAGAIDVGDWGQGVNIGRVTDENRQLNGWMDEFYIYTRALDDAEIATLANLSTDNVLKGDTNGDDRVDFDDISPFVLSLNDAALFDSNFTNLAFGHRAVARADMNGNDFADFDDISLFVARLGAGTASVVPEPSTCLLAIMGLLGLIGVARRR